MTWQRLSKEGMRCRRREVEKHRWGERVEETREQGRSWEEHWEQGWASEGDAAQVFRQSRLGWSTGRKQQKTEHFIVVRAAQLTETATQANLNLNQDFVKVTSCLSSLKHFFLTLMENIMKSSKDVKETRNDNCGQTNFWGRHYRVFSCKMCSSVYSAKRDEGSTGTPLLYI